MSLPSDWDLRRLDDVADVRLGRQRSPKNHAGSQMRPYLRAANVGWSGLRLDDVKEMNFTDDEMAIYRLVPGDIVLSEASGSPDEVGKPAIWLGQIDECAFQNTLLRVRSHSPEPRYLLHFFSYLAQSGAFASKSRGVGIHHIGRAALAQWPIPTPPISEQQRIVEILEDHLSRLDAADAGIAKAERRLKALHKSVLLKLIPDVADYPADWKTSTVEQAGKVDLGRQRHPDWHAGPNMRPYLRVANVFEDRIDTRSLYEMHWPGDRFDRFRLLPGDVLLNEGQTPELLGRPALYRGHPSEVAFTNSLLRFRASEAVLPEFALLVFRRHMHAGRFTRESRITTNIAHLSAARLKPIEFPIPPMSVQEELVDRAEQQLSALTRLSVETAAAKARSAGLRRALLGAAFSGRLT